MSKILWLAIIAIIALTAGGALEVQFRPERLSNVPGRLSQLVQSKSTLERGRTIALNLKRTGEQWIIQDDQQKLEIVTQDIQSDAGRLQEQLVAETDPEVILPQADLLLASLDRAKQIASAASTDALASVQDETAQAQVSAYAALEKLQAEQQRYAAVQEEFAKITGRLREHLGSGGEPAGAVAGSQTTEQSTAPATPVPTIPLSF